MTNYGNPWLQALPQYGLIPNALLAGQPSQGDWLGFLASNPTPTAAAMTLNSESDLANALGASVWRIRQAMRKTGKGWKDLMLTDLANIPELPDNIKVGGVDSRPNPRGAPASWVNPTGGSGTWGGLTDAQIQAAFLASAGDDPNLARQMWEEEHRREQQANGF